MERRILLHPAGRGLTPPLEAALEARGIVFRALDATVDAATLAQSLACIIWFYLPLRQPITVLRLHRRLHAAGVPLIAWNRDAPHYLNRSPWRLDLLDRFRVLDIYATHTLIDEKRRFADLVLYLPNAADIEKYNPRGEPVEVLRRLRDPSGYRWDVSFFGGMDGTRYKEDRARQDFFAALAEKLDRRGISHCFRESTGMTIDEQVAFLQASRINLNFGARCEYGAPIASGLPERCYGIPACGGFLLCDRRTHAATDFVIGENWAEFDGLDDCVAKIEYWLAHFDAARDLAERCHRHVMTHHTYAHRAGKLHEALLAWHEGRRGLIE